MKKFTQLNESQKTYDNFLNMPPVESLGDGEFEGALRGNCFVYAGKKYYVETGTRNIHPYKVSITIKDGEIQKPYNYIDNYQHPELKNLFQD